MSATLDCPWCRRPGAVVGVRHTCGFLMKAAAKARKPKSVAAAQRAVLREALLLTECRKGDEVRVGRLFQRIWNAAEELQEAVALAQRPAAAIRGRGK